jgi:signal peptidase complex subunit 3
VTPRDATRSSQVVIWDSIIEWPEDARLREENIFVKYALIDQVAELRNASITLRLVWDHMPITGQLFMSASQVSSFSLPGKYQ